MARHQPQATMQTTLPYRVRNLPGFSSKPARIAAISCFAALNRAGNMKSHKNDCADAEPSNRRKCAGPSNAIAGAKRGGTHLGRH
jgi:hypothetical protein